MRSYGNLLSLMCPIEDAKVALEKRVALMEERSESLGSAALDYEAATEDPTEAEEARLDRMIGISNRAANAASDLAERVRLYGEALTSIEEAYCIERRRRDYNTRKRNMRKAGSSPASKG